MKLYTYTSEYRVHIILLIIIVIATIIHSILLDAPNLKSREFVYKHYDLMEFSFRGPEDIMSEGLIRAEIYKNDKKVKTIGGQEFLNFKYFKDSKLWKAQFPVPWAAEDGLYWAILIDQSGKSKGLKEYFIINSRVSDYDFLKKSLRVLDLESTKRLQRFRVRTPKGELKDYSAIYDWSRYIAANTIWYMVGQTASYKPGDLTQASPWVHTNIGAFEKFAEKTVQEGMEFGGWISCFRAFGKSSLKPSWYKYSMKYMRSKSSLQNTLGISISDNKRIEDIISLAKRLNADKNVAYIGLDYIRPAGGGLELVEEFSRAMDIDLPSAWSNFTKRDKMKWLGEIVTRPKHRGDPVIDQWNWWRAHRMSLIIQRIRKEVKPVKPIWTFVLSWELGHQHGQDPIMFSDAGSDLLSIMFYETDAPRFNYMLRQWKEYLHGRNINIAVGNQIDWVVHQKSVFPAGPEEYGRRLEESAYVMKELSCLKGVFIHDFARLIGGRRGPYPASEWAAASSRTFNLLPDNSLNISLKTPDSINSGDRISAQIEIMNNSKKDHKNVEWQIYMPDSNIKGNSEGRVDLIKAGESHSIKRSINLTAGADIRRLGRYMLTLSVKSEDETLNAYSYMWIKGAPVDGGVYSR